MKNIIPASFSGPFIKTPKLINERASIFKLEIEKKENLLTKSKILFLLSNNAKIPENIDQPITNKGIKIISVKSAISRSLLNDSHVRITCIIKNMIISFFAFIDIILN